MRMNPDGVMEKIVRKPIKGFEGLYEINQFGDVISLSHKVRAKNDTFRVLNEKIVKPSIGDKRVLVALYKNNTQSLILVKRLVAEAFLNFDRNDRSTAIRNADGDITNNYYKNLIKEDLKECRTNTLRKVSGGSSKCVKCVNEKGDELKFESVDQAARHFNFKTPKTVRRRIKNGNKYYDGWKWSFDNISEFRSIPLDKRKGAIDELLSEGYTQKDICILYDISDGIYRRALRHKPSTNVVHQRKSIDEIKQHLQKKYEDMYEFPFIDDEYRSGGKYITIRCPIHGDVKMFLSSIIYRQTTCVMCKNLRYSLSVKYGQDISFDLLKLEYRRLKLESTNDKGEDDA